MHLEKGAIRGRKGSYVPHFIARIYQPVTVLME